MAALPYIQLYIADYLADTMHLTTEEHGAYLLIIFNYWQTAKPIPKNRLARIAKVSGERWAEMEDTLSEFFEDDGEKWIHLRIENDLNAVNTKPRAGESLSGYSGYVYFAGSDDLDVVKIGYSKNPWARISELRRDSSSNYENLRILCTAKTKEKSESGLHKLLADHHLSDEWFFRDGLINNLIDLVSSKKITTVAEIITTVAEFDSNYDDQRSSATTTTNTDTDTDKDKDKDKETDIKNKTASAEVLKIFQHWQARMNHPGAKLDDKRRKKIIAALKLGYSADDLISAIDGCAKSPYHMGGNPDGTVYDSIDLIFRGADKIDKFIKQNLMTAGVQNGHRKLTPAEEIHQRLQAGQPTEHGSHMGGDDGHVWEHMDEPIR